MNDDGKRQAARSNMLLTAQLRVGDGPEHPCRVRNISATGLMIEMAWPQEGGDNVSVKLGELGWVAATVAWRQPPRFGLAFLDAIDPVAARRPVGETPKPFEPDPPDFRKRVL